MSKSKKKNKNKKKDIPKIVTQEKDTNYIELPLSSFISNTIYYYLKDRKVSITCPDNTLLDLVDLEQDICSILGKTFKENNIKDSHRFKIEAPPQ